MEKSRDADSVCIDSAAEAVHVMRADADKSLQLSFSVAMVLMVHQWVADDRDWQATVQPKQPASQESPSFEWCTVRVSRLQQQV